MSRSKKKPEYEKNRIMNALLQAISECYQDTDRGNLSLRQVAAEFDMTHLKARKLLITAGAYNTDISDKVNDLKVAGKTIPEIMSLTCLSRASVHSYLPYTKVVYNAKELSLNAERIRRYRERQEAVKLIKYCLDNKEGDLSPLVWNAIEKFEDYPFYTVKNLKYRYAVKGQEILVSRKEKSITKATIDLALDNVVKLERNVTGPKQLGVFGASYIYPIFKRLEII